MFRLHFEELLPDLSEALSAMPKASSLSSRTHIDDFSLDEYHTYEEVSIASSYSIPQCENNNKFFGDPLNAALLRL